MRLRTLGWGLLSLGLILLTSSLAADVEVREQPDDHETAGFASRAAAEGQVSPTGPTAVQERRRQGALVMDGMPEIPPRLARELSPYMSIRSAGFGGWHPSGDGILITTRFGETRQIHHVASPLAARRQLTFYDEPVGGLTVSPAEATEGFLFTKDVGGGEAYQVYFYDLSSGQARLLSDGEARHGAPVWSADGQRFAYFTTRRNGKDWDIVGGSPAMGEDHLLWRGTGAWVPVQFSPGGGRLMVNRLVSANENYPYLLDLDSGELTPFQPSAEKVSFGRLRFSKDGRSIFFTSDADSEVQRLRRYDLESGQEAILSQAFDWNVEDFALSADGRLLAYSVNVDGSSQLQLLALEGDARLTGELPMGRIGGLEFSPDSSHLAFQLNSPRSPGDVFSYDLTNGNLVRWTHSEIGGLDDSQFVLPELIRYPTFDMVDGEARQIPAFYYRPEGDGPFATIVRIHGGPEGQSRPTFDSLLQYWVNEMGIAVLVPNVRGSSGYGKSYLKLDNGRLREDSVADIGALLDWIGERPELDSERVAVMGGSYGGYMVLASLVHYSERLRAAVDVVGISNFVTFLENTKDYRRDLRRVEYGDERDPEMRRFLESISPANQAEKMRSPLFIVQGLNDPRVPVTESEQMLAELRRQGKDVWYLMAEDEGHGFRKQGNRDIYNQAVVLFLQRYLLSSSSPTAPAAQAASAPAAAAVQVAALQ